MKRQIIDDAKQLVGVLGILLDNKEYVFRGQPDAKYWLIPSALRDCSLKKISVEFPIEENKTRIWFLNEKAQEPILQLTPHLFRDSKTREISERMKHLSLILMQYNYSLYKRKPLKIPYCALKIYSNCLSTSFAFCN